MRKIISHRTVGVWLFACLMLTLPNLFWAQSIQSCPDYPRAMDQVYACLETSTLQPAPLQLTYAITFDQNATLHNPVRFTFPAFPSNITVNFDAGDGNGPSTLSSGEIKTISYTSPGRYNLSWNIICGGPECVTAEFSGATVFQTNFNPDFPYSNDPEDIIPSSELNVKTYTPSPGAAYPPGSPYTSATTAGGITHILYANPDHQIRKPFILVEGFDPIIGPSNKYVVNNLQGATLGYGEVRWDVITTGRRESFDVDPNEPGVPHTPQFDLFPTLLADLRNRGYDIIFVDFADGGTYLQANAEYLIGVLEWVNSRKITDEENVLLGASMGGIIGRYALAKLESEGNSHCTGLFFTLDSPHNGANIPLSLQALGWYFHYNGDTDEAWNAMETPAARQMLIKTLGAAVQEGLVTPENDDLQYTKDVDFSELYSADYALLRNQFNSELDGFGWPKLPRKIGLSDGMRNGTLNNGQGFSPGEKFYEGTGYANDYNLGTVFKLVLRANNGGGPDFYSISGMYSCSNYQENGFSDNHLFTIARPIDLNPCFGKKIPYKYHVWRLNVTGDLPFLDNAPGGFRLDLRAIHDKLKSDVGSTSSNVDYQTPINLPKITFVPTWSGLAMGTELTNENLFVDLHGSEFDEDNLPNAKIPNFDNFYAPEISLRHVELDAGMIDLILSEVDGLLASPQAGILTETYNYGKRYINIPSTTISANGVLNINNTGPTGYLPSHPLDAADKPLFTTYLNSCGQLITVENGGQYNIGALDKSQHGVTEVWKGATVHVKAGGTLHITSEQSQLWIKAGATLILDPGAIVNLESPGSEIYIQGDLVVNGDIHFQGKGFFHFGEGNQLVFGPGYNTFNLRGAGKQQRFVRASAYVVVDKAHRLHWQDGLLEAAGPGSIYLIEGAGLDFEDMTLTGNGGTAVETSESGPVTFSRCDVHSLDQAIYGHSGLGCSVIDCNFFKNTGWGLHWDNAFLVTVQRSVFDGADCTTALNMENVGIVKLEDSQFYDYFSDPLDLPPGLGDLEGASPAVSLSEVVACLVNNCTFRGNAVAIKASDPNTGGTANVYAYGGSYFGQNGAAVYMTGSTTQGAVLADCVDFDRNHNGVRGKDITLMIDSWNTKTYAFDSDSPNKFIRDGNPLDGETTSHVDICYDQKGVGSSNLMRNNFWAVDDGSGLLTMDNTPIEMVFLKNASCSDTIATPAFAPFSSPRPLCLLEQRPDNFETAFPGSECELLTDELSNVSVHEQFHLATYLMKTGSESDGIKAMRPVAALWQPEMKEFPENCRQYITVAKAFVDAADQNAPLMPRPGAARDERHPVDHQLLIMPNPAAQTALIRLSDQPCRIRVWNVNGVLVHEATASEAYSMDIAAWTDGMYFVEALAADGTRKTARLMVQH